MRKFNRFMALSLTVAMAAASFAGCGDKTQDSTTAATTAATTKATDAGTDAGTDSTTTAAATPSGEGEGSVLNIQCWNEEFKSRVTDHYPGYTEVDATHGKIGDVDVVWTITPTKDNAYQNQLDKILPENASAAADDKVDIFLMEADYALKYVNNDVSMPVADLGITDADIADQYQYTKDIVTSSDGKLKGLSWQACSAGLIYNRDAAAEVLGTEDPDAVQEFVKDWATFNTTAAKLKDAGYKVVSTVNDTYRVYSNNVSTPWVVDGKITIDANLSQWVTDSKALVDAGETTTFGLWSDEWSAGFYPDGKVFSYFGPAWLINFCMAADKEGSIANSGRWGYTVGPQAFYWGGTWIAAANGTDNPTLVKDLMLTMTTDKAVLKEIVQKDSDCVNCPTLLNELAADSSFASAILGGQNPYAMLAAGAEKVDMSNISAYDQGCNEEFQNAMTNYFDGNASLDEATDNFYKAVVEKYPELTY